MFHIKRRNFIFLFLTFTIFIKISLQQILFPIHINFDDDDDEEEEENQNQVKTYDDGVKPIYEKRVYTYNDKNGNPITVTHISYKSGNLGGTYNKGLTTPFEIMRNFDRRLNSMFEDFFRESIGIRHILNEMDRDEEEFEKRIRKDFFGDNVAIEDNSKNEDNNGNNNEDNEGEDKKKNMKKIGKLSIDEDKMKNAVNKKKKKLSRRQLIFSRICKYIFYSIILFTVYIMAKKLLEFLEIIDPEDYVEVKINNEPDEETFITLKLAKESLDAGGAAPAVLHAANEVAVDAFLSEKCSFIDIFDIIANVSSNLSESRRFSSLEDILNYDEMARRAAIDLLRNR